IAMVSAKAVTCNVARVKSVRLQIGEASSILTDSLTFCFAMLTEQEPLLAGARLLIDNVPHRAWCCCCQSEFAVVDFVMQCPLCKEWNTKVVSGTELQIAEMEVELVTSTSRDEKSAALFPHEHGQTGGQYSCEISDRSKYPGG
ncbi:MAG: hydrogenase maturation nickel metallochaperone HypA, partial [Ktedonobacteraceae bacterium]|nr:hydrogenase maturation nickel metallochaperone HypA [Ktedonobacteraceae bacterium]